MTRMQTALPTYCRLGSTLPLLQDIVDPAFVTAVSAMAACTMQLQPLGASSILLRTCMKKRSGPDTSEQHASTMK